MTIKDRLVRWGAMGAAGIADHGFFSGSNLLMALLLGRWLPPAAFGAFSVAFSIHLLFFAVHNALVLEPACVIGPSSYSDRVREYSRSLIRSTWILGAVCSLGLLAIGGFAFVRGSPLAGSCLALAFAEPFLLFVWTARRLAYVRSRPGIAAAISVVYAAILLAGIAGLKALQSLSAPYAFLLLGVVSLLAGLLLQRRLLRDGAPEPQSAPIPLRPLAAEHYRFGKWFLAGYGVSWLSSAAYVPLLGWLGGLGDAGALRAIECLFLPAQQLLTTVGALVVPRVAQQAAAQAPAALRSTAWKLCAAATLLTLAYSVTLILAGRWLLRLIYPDSPYAESYIALPWLSAELVARGICDTSFGTALRVLRRPDVVFRATAIAGLFSMVAGVLMTHASGVRGAACARACTALVYLAATLPPTLRILRTREASA